MIFRTNKMCKVSIILICKELKREKTSTVQARHLTLRNKQKCNRSDLTPAIHSANAFLSGKGCIYQQHSWLRLRQDKRRVQTPTGPNWSKDKVCVYM